MPQIANIELGVANIGSSEQMNLNGAGTYYKNNCATSAEEIPFVFLQPIYQKKYSSGWKDNFSQSIQQITKSCFNTKIQRTDAPHSGWKQDLRVMYGRIWVKNTNPNA